MGCKDIDRDDFIPDSFFSKPNTEGLGFNNLQCTKATAEEELQSFKLPTTVATSEPAVCGDLITFD